MNIFGPIIHAVSALGHVLVYQPLFNALVFIYTHVPGKDFGVAIIILTFVVRLLLYPLGAKAFHSAKSLAALSPKVEEINEKFKHDKNELSRRMFELYQKEKVSPFSALLPMLAQFPIFIALYSVVRNGFHSEQLPFLYHFIANPGPINPHFLGLVNLGEKSIAVAIVAGVLQLIQTRQSMQFGLSGSQGKKSANKNAMQAQAGAMYAFPLVTFVFLLRLPSALGLYWIATSVFSIFQQWHLSRKVHNPKPETQNI